MKLPSLKDREALFRLFGAASDGTISEQEAADLQQALASSPAARKLWFLHQDLELGLDEWASSRSQQAPALITPATPVAFSRPRPRRTFPAAKLAIAAAVAAAIGLSLWFAASRPATLATLQRSSAARWESTPLTAGSPMVSSQELNLASGIVELSMTSGARVVFEGPGRMVVLSRNSVRLDAGRLHAHVPPAAKGFSVEGRGFSLIDHGTRFGCTVTEGKPAEVHVFDGLVEVRPEFQSPALLQKNEAVSFDRNSVEKIAVRPDAFVSSEDLDELQGPAGASHNQASRMLKNHPAALLYLDASGLDQDSLVNQAAAVPLAARSRVTAHHCTTTGGRLPGRAAIAFDGLSSRIDIEPFRRTHQSLTLVAWIRTPTALRRQNLLCGSGNFIAGEPAWYLYYHNALGFGAHSPVRGRPGHGWRSLHSAPPAAPLNQWSMIATVVDGRNRTITHFLNGKILGMGQVSLPPAIHLGPLTIGAPRQDHSSQTHHFHGAIDEFALIAEPLTAEEILRIYQFGHRSNP